MSERPKLPGDVARAIAVAVDQQKQREEWSAGDGADLSLAIAELVARQVAGIPGVYADPVDAQAIKIAAAVTERQWSEIGPEKLERWIMTLLSRTMATIFRSHATEVRACKGWNCKQVLAMVPDYSRGGMLIPFDFETGVNHFATCPDRERFRRPAGSVNPKEPLPPDPVTRTVNAVDAAQIEMFDRSRTRVLDRIEIGGLKQ